MSGSMTCRTANAAIAYPTRARNTRRCCNSASRGRCISPPHCRGPYHVLTPATAAAPPTSPPQPAAGAPRTAIAPRPPPGSDRQVPSLPRAQPHRLDDLQHEDLPIPQLPRPRRPLDGVDRLRDHFCLGDHLDLHLRHEVHDVLGAAVELLVPLLAAEAPHFADGHSAHSDGVESVLHLVDPRGPDDRFDFLHLSPFPARPPTSCRFCVPHRRGKR